MKNIFVFLILPVFIFLSCSKPVVKNSYSGFIYWGNIPLAHVKVLEQNTDNFSYTDSKGYFKLKRSNLKNINNLVVYSKKHSDTLKLLRGVAAGSNNNYLFLSNKKDTCDLNRERIFKLQSR
ncbi:hypothetical protein [Chryseobacterium gregarium]|uniref:hypothetical protein n=1 Tax=Chryseobacterium gregarium TaxID=456299 RepID=UPI00042A57AD|nr:hypothetical protein [Chryseobacterium gregarium]